jgi:cyclophilin family peptidyl-prolyl cis-trans isomerase
LKINKWILLIILLAVLIGVNHLLSNKITYKDEAELQQEVDKQEFIAKQPKATLQLGDVLVLNTTLGEVRVVMYEKDCPITTSEIKRLVNEGGYNGVKFDTNFTPGPTEILSTLTVVKGKMKNIPREAYFGGAINVRNSVALATSPDPKAKLNGNLLFIPEFNPQMEGSLNVFGRIVSEYNFMMKVRPGLTAYIKSAKIEKLSAKDKEIYKKILDADKKRMLAPPGS